MVSDLAIRSVTTIPLVLDYPLQRLFNHCHRTVINGLSQLPCAGILSIMVRDISYPLLRVSSLCQILTESSERIHCCPHARQADRI
jgi:hypothetical protein